MKQYLQRAATAAALVLIPLAFTACDFSAIENPADDFSLIIELPPINTVVNGQIVDAATQEPLRGRVTLTFEGQAAGRIVDAYSDPIQKLVVDNGIVSFGIDNALVPTENAPVAFKVRASAPGYFTGSQEVILSQAGSGDFIVRLSRNNPTQQATGTAGTQAQSGTTSASGGVAQTVVVGTPPTHQTAAQAAVTLAQGTVPTTRSGQALQGQLTVTVRVFDPARGLTALPQDARQDDRGRTLSVAGAVYVKVVDASGNVAATFQGGGAGKTAATCAGGLKVGLTVTDPDMVAAFQMLRAADPGATVRADVWAYTLADQQNVRVGQVTLEEGATASELTATLCVGGSTPTVDVTKLGDIEEGIVYSVVLQGGQVRTCKLDATLALTNPNASTLDLTQVALVGPGLNLQGLPSFPATGSRRLGDVLQHADEVTLINGAGYTLTGFVQGQPVSASVVNPCQGAYNVAVPAIANTQTYTVHAALSCPAGQKFDVQLTEQSVDALSVSYRRKGSNDLFTFLKKSTVSRNITQSSITASADLVLLPSTTYEFKAVYGTESTNYDASTPTSGTTVDMSFNPSEAGMTCVAR